MNTWPGVFQWLISSQVLKTPSSHLNLKRGLKFNLISIWWTFGTPSNRTCQVLVYTDKWDHSEWFTI